MLTYSMLATAATFFACSMPLAGAAWLVAAAVTACLSSLSTDDSDE